MCAAREPRRFNGLCDTCCWLGHLSCDCLLQRDRIYSDVPTLSSPPISPRHTAVAAAAPSMLSRVLRRSTVVVIAIVRNRSCDATAATMLQHCRRSSSQLHAPSLALSGTRGTTASIVQRRSSSSHPHALSLALSGTRGTSAATAQRRSSSQALCRHATSDGCNHLAGPSHRQPLLSRTRPLRSGFSRTIWRCRFSPSRRDHSSRRQRQ